jgi:hypothetical protein
MVRFLEDLRRGLGHGDSTVSTASGGRRFHSPALSGCPLSPAICPHALCVFFGVASSVASSRPNAGTRVAPCLGWLCILVVASQFSCTVFHCRNQSNSLVRLHKEERTLRHRQCAKTGGTTIGFPTLKRQFNRAAVGAPFIIFVCPIADRNENALQASGLCLDRRTESCFFVPSFLFRAHRPEFIFKSSLSAFPNQFFLILA